MAKQETKEDVKFDYKHFSSFKLSEEFKQRFMTKSAGGPTMSVDGLVAIGHKKGIWKIDTEVLQYPNAENNNMCICKATIGGYDWDPIEEKVTKVEFSDIGDACPNLNVSGQVAKSYIRMAATRAIGRALRKYVNIDMICSEELADDDIVLDKSNMMSQKSIDMKQMEQMKGIITQKGIQPQAFGEILIKTFNTNTYENLSYEQAEQLIGILNNYIVPNK